MLLRPSAKVAKRHPLRLALPGLAGSRILDKKSKIQDSPA